MPVLRQLPGFRILEAALQSRTFALPGGVTPMAYAEMLALSEFGCSLTSLTPAFPSQDASEEEFSIYYQRFEAANHRFRCEFLDGSAALAFFDDLKWDLADDQRHFSASGRIFGRLIEAMATGLLGGAPNSEIEAWRQATRQIDHPLREAANDYEALWNEDEGSA
jgi:hypothetical protein